MKLIHLLAGKCAWIQCCAGWLTSKGPIQVVHKHIVSSSSRGINVCVCAVSMYASGLPPINRTHVTFICPVCAASVYFMAQPWSAGAAFWGPVNGDGGKKDLGFSCLCAARAKRDTLGFWICNALHNHKIWCVRPPVPQGQSQLNWKQTKKSSLKK